MWTKMEANHGRMINIKSNRLKNRPRNPRWAARLYEPLECQSNKEACKLWRQLPLFELLLIYAEILSFNEVMAFAL